VQNLSAEAMSAPPATDPLAEAQAAAVAVLNRNADRRAQLIAEQASRTARVDRYATGPGRLLCDRCGYNFDPIANDWACPHCRTAWPWRKATP
jgi:rubrerythrin